LRIIGLSRRFEFRDYTAAGRTEDKNGRTIKQPAEQITAAGPVEDSGVIVVAIAPVTARPGLPVVAVTRIARITGGGSRTL
jgi:hypothetical protein